MIAVRKSLAACSATVLLAVCSGTVLLAGCSGTVAGTPTWPGATLARLALTGADFPPGVGFDVISDVVETPGAPDGADAPGAMRSRPEGCTDALTNVIAGSAERGPGSAVKYAVSYDGARIMMTVLSWNLDLDRLRAAAERCARFEAFFDPDSPGIPITTTALSGLESEALAYQQTMTLNAAPSSVFMAFQNVGPRAAFAIAYPTPDPTLPISATLPQTFLEVFGKQIAKLRSS